MLLIPSIMYDEWIAIKAARSESSKKWCKRYGIEEQRFYELTKLKSQFTELLQDAGLLARGVEAPRPALTQRMREQKAEIKRLIRDKETKSGGACCQLRMLQRVQTEVLMRPRSKT